MLKMLIRERLKCQKETKNGMYSASMFSLACTLVQIPATYLAVLPGVTIGYWIVGLNPNPNRFMLFVLFTGAFAQVVESITFLFSTRLDQSAGTGLVLGLLEITVVNLNKTEDAHR